MAKAFMNIYRNSNCLTEKQLEILAQSDSMARRKAARTSFRPDEELEAVCTEIYNLFVLLANDDGNMPKSGLRDRIAELIIAHADTLPAYLDPYMDQVFVVDPKEDTAHRIATVGELVFYNKHTREILRFE